VSPRALRRVGWLGVALFLAAGLGTPTPAPGSPGARLLGPFSRLAAQVQWIRFQRARLRGDDVEALERAQAALALDPGPSEGWQALAAHLALDLAAPEREPDVARRARLLAAGLSVLEQGARVAEHPAELELARGLLLYTKSQVDPAVDPRGEPGLLLDATRALERSAALGSRTAADLAGELRARLATPPPAGDGG